MARTSGGSAGEVRAHQPCVEDRRQDPLLDPVRQREAGKGGVEPRQRQQRRGDRRRPGLASPANDVLGKHRRRQGRDFGPVAVHRDDGPAPLHRLARPRRPVRVTVMPERSLPSQAVKRCSGSSQRAAPESDLSQPQRTGQLASHRNHI